MDYEMLGERVRSRRKELRLTQGALADRVGISTSFLGHIERGTRVLSVETLVQLCRVLNITPNDLLGVEVDPAIQELPEELQSFGQALLLNTMDLVRKHLAKAAI